MRKKDSISNLIEKLYHESERKEFTALELAKVLDLDRSNVSRYLNALVREGYLEKIEGRPVYFRLKSDEMKVIGILCWDGTDRGKKIEKILKSNIKAPIRTILIEIDAFDSCKTKNILNSYCKENDFSFFVSTFPVSINNIDCVLVSDILHNNF